MTLPSTRQLKKDFPFLKSGIAFLDNASTTQKPQCVIDATTDYYRASANVHRGIYQLSERATEQYEAVRDHVQRLIGAEAREEIIFTSGATASLNTVAYMLAQQLTAGDEIILTAMEHHSNLVPWQLIAKEKGLKLVFLQPCDDALSIDELEKRITARTKVISMTHVSNASGYIVPVADFARVAHARGIRVVVDAAQSVPHMPVNVQELGADFLAFSAHKMCGPTGVGVLYGKRELLEQFEPIHGGGSMIEEVTLEASTWAPLPAKFEAGTPNIAGVLGFGAALTYLEQIGFATIQKTVDEVYDYACTQMADCYGVELYGPKDRALRQSILSFTVDGVHPHDVATILDQEGVAVRAGHHCAQPLMQCWGVPATTRASLYFYNTKNDVDRLIAGIAKAQSIFAT